MVVDAGRVVEWDDDCRWVWVPVTLAAGACAPYKQLVGVWPAGEG